MSTFPGAWDEIVIQEEVSAAYETDLYFVSTWLVELGWKRMCHVSVMNYGIKIEIILLHNMM